MSAAAALPEPEAQSELRGQAEEPSRLLGLGIEAALQTLGQAFLDHPENAALRASLREPPGGAESYLGELFGLVYRCVFLCCAEARGCLHPEQSSAAARGRYARSHSLARLRRSPRARAGTTLWSALRAVFRGLEAGDARLGLPALGGVFAGARCPRLDRAELDDRALLEAFAQLDGRGQAQQGPIAWSEVSPELLGGAYEGLLALEPRLLAQRGALRWQARGEDGGGRRRRTGSYYTPPHLVQALLDAALEPLIQQTLRAAPDEPMRALTELAIVDPACGSGYFLLAAARRLAGHVARVAPLEQGLGYRRALGRVVASCLYGIDLEPMAVEICRLGLWLEAADPALGLAHFEARVVRGNSLLGTTPERLSKGIPDAAWKALPGEDRASARALEARNRARAAPAAAAAPPASKELADAWCAAFFWPKERAAERASAPTNELWLPALQGQTELPELTRRIAGELAARHHFCHWQLAFPAVFARGGFDLVLGNPPWIAHAGRAAQRLPPSIKRFFEHNYEAFADYPTTHGVFVQVAAGALRAGGYLGLVIPSSLSELGGYAPTRLAHDRLCEFPEELIDFGEGQFAGVTQPCMALVSRRSAGGRRDRPAGEPWPMQRTDLNAVGRALLARLEQLPSLPAELFGERGVQSDKQLLEHFLAAASPAGRFDAPIREGTDVREFELRAPRWHVDRAALGARMRSVQEFQRVRVLVRQTARYPIAALSDGLAFRNSLLAVFETPSWPAPALVALLNSALIRWQHYMRFRDARQPILPQLKISHLRSIPAPPRGARRLLRFGERLGGGAPTARLRAQLDELVFTLYGLDAQERELVSRWHAELAPRPRLPSA